MSPPDRVHLWNRCDHCGAAPIVGRRYHCESCPAGPDNDLCEKCYPLQSAGLIPHPSANRMTGTVMVAQHDFREYPGTPADGFDAWLQIAAAPQDPPTVADRFVVRPEFRGQSVSTIGAYGFVVDAPVAGAHLFLTALHVLDELIRGHGVDAGCDNASYTGRELPAVVQRAVLYDPFAEIWMTAELGEAAPMLTLPQARVDSEEPVSDRDLAAFWIRDASPFRPGRLATGAPAVGDPVWLVYRTPDDARCRTAQAVVVESTERTLIYRFLDGDAVPSYTSGAPILDRDGAVAGIMVGAGWYRGNRLSHAHNIRAMRRHLEQGIAITPPPG